MGLILKIKIDDKPVRAMLSGARERMQNLRPVFDDFGAYMIRSVGKNFLAGGRPTSWPPSRKRAGGKTLIESGRLKNSMAYVASNQGMILGTNVPYAAIHQFGGVIRPVSAKMLAIPLNRAAARMRPREMAGGFVARSKAGNLILFQKQISYTGQKGKRFLSKGEFKEKVVPMYALKEEVRIPQRKFLLFQKEDRDYLQLKAARYIVSGKL